MLDMKLTHSTEKHDFYIGKKDNKFVFNIVPKNNPKPKAGYYDYEYILTIKGYPSKDTDVIKYFFPNHFVIAQTKPKPWQLS